MILVALVVGFGLSYYALTDGRLLGALKVGPWAAWPAVGSPAPDPLLRGPILPAPGRCSWGKARALPSPPPATATGRALDRSCRYRIDGTTPVASFWTLQAVAPDGSNVARPDGPQFLESRHIARANDGSLVLYVSHALAPDNWLEIGGNGAFRLVLTLLRSVEPFRFRHCGADAAVDPEGSVWRMRIVVWLLAGVVLGVIIHFAVILSLPALASDTVWSRIARHRRGEQAGGADGGGGRRRQSARARPGPQLCRVPGRPRGRAGRGQRHAPRRLLVARHLQPRRLGDLFDHQPRRHRAEPSTSASSMPTRRIFWPSSRSTSPTGC